MLFFAASSRSEMKLRLVMVIQFSNRPQEFVRILRSTNSLPHSKATYRNVVLERIELDGHNEARFHFEPSREDYAKHNLLRVRGVELGDVT